jgi:DNA-binding CsgD family transcriptional regulator
MKTESYIPNEWAIPKEKQRILTESRIKRILTFLNRNSKGDYCLLDYQKQKLIIGARSTVLISGFPKNFVEEKGLNFYNEILEEEEQKWVQQVSLEALKIFYEYPESERLNLELIYDFFLKTAGGLDVFQRHQIIPYELCSNGNLWMALCYVSEIPLCSHQNFSRKASFVQTETGEKYDFNGNTFEKTISNFITDEDIEILKYWATGLETKQIPDMLKCSETSVRRDNRKVLKKLNAITEAQAVHLAHLKGIL